MNRCLHRWWWLAGLLSAMVVLGGCGLIRISEEEATAQWERSAHADTRAPAFTNWNRRDPAEIPVECAACHSTPGFLDFHGADGSQVGTVEQAVPVGSTVECEACHNETIEEIRSVTLPSGHSIANLGRQPLAGNATCATCHAGRAAGSDVATVVDGSRLDVVNPELRFINIHNNAAMPLLLGATGGAGYEYEGKEYAGRETHLFGFRTCTECHQPHRLRIAAQQCNACHLGIRSSEQLINIRTSNVDYDGDANINEGIAKEISTLRSRLLVLLKQYAAELPEGNGLDYRDSFPFFVDDNGETFAQWTPRLLRTAYNFHLVTKSPGAYAHNAHYTLQLLYDSIDDLQGDLRGAVRP